MVQRSAQSGNVPVYSGSKHVEQFLAASNCAGQTLQSALFHCPQHEQLHPVVREPSTLSEWLPQSCDSEQLRSIIQYGKLLNPKAHVNAGCTSLLPLPDAPLPVDLMQ
jgi:hypothetical protein